MKTASAHELRNNCVEAGQAIHVAKRGLHSSRVAAGLKESSFLGAGAGTMKLPVDIDDPVGVEWEAAQ